MPISTLRDSACLMALPQLQYLMSQRTPSSCILLVGSSPDQMEKTREYLARGGYHTICADYGEAQHQYLQSRPDGAIIETGPAHSDSLAVCHDLRLRAGAAFPLLLLTADERGIHPRSRIQHYADDYLLGPIDCETLLVRLSVLLKRKQLQAASEETADEVSPAAAEVSDFLRLTEAARRDLTADQPGAIALLGVETPGETPADEGLFSQALDDERAVQQRLALASLSGFLAARLGPRSDGECALASYGSFSLLTYQPRLTAVELAERLSAWRAEFSLLNQGEMVAGTAAFPEDADNLLDLIARADEAMAQARHQCRIVRYRQAPPATATSHPHQLLIVDDNPEQVELLALLAASEGYDTLRAYNGAQALEVLSKQKPDLLLLDLLMPQLDGFGVMHRLRDRHGGHLQPPVIMITANDCEESVLRGFELGARDYVIKPFHPRELLSRIHSVLANPPAAGEL
jgi:DNA-binding response OmpR family regulator